MVRLVLSGKVGLMKYADVAENVRQLLEDLPPQDEFIYELLRAYGKPKASITRLKQGTYNQSKNPDEVLWKKEVWFKAVNGDLFAAIDWLKTAKGTKTHNPRFLFVTDFKQILAVDRKTNDTLDIKFRELETNFDFFLPWAGMEKTKLSNENPADIKAAEKMAKLFDAIKLDNPDYLREDPHAMNVFLGRLLFCLFAEDTGIFPENAVTNAVASHTAVDGSDLDVFFKRLFDWLDTPEQKRGLTTKYTKDTKDNPCKSVSSGVQNYSSIMELPYVNGGLFREHFDIPAFSAKSRRMIIESGELNWSEINPDIFGSMFQAVIDQDERDDFGQHYTSVTNIMKVIEPLFLNDFKAEFEKASDRKTGKKQALHRLLDRIAKVKIFDPACGSGNFLIIAYKELRKLEMKVFTELQAIEGTFPISRMNVNQFYGIEISDFACEAAILALWLAEHQMNLEYKRIFGQTLVSLPLRESAHIICDNATRIDWKTLCPNNQEDEIYILGNPPYKGAKEQTNDQKHDRDIVWRGITGIKKLDYVCNWFRMASVYLKGSTNVEAAFVATNSITQGEQPPILWKYLFEDETVISFAHQSFVWSNFAKNQAHVHVVIIGLMWTGKQREKLLISADINSATYTRTVSNINPYLIEGSNLIVGSAKNHRQSIAPKFHKGCEATDYGFLTLNNNERDSLLDEEPILDGYIRPFIGGKEYINGLSKWCLWMESAPTDVLTLDALQTRLNSIATKRAESSKQRTLDLAATPHLFGEIRQPANNYLLIPKVSSQSRDYIPMGFVDSNTIASGSSIVSDEADAVSFGIITSRMHMVWMRAICGRTKSDYQYSVSVVYNNFPFPKLTHEQRQIITMHLAEVLEARENHSQKTLAQLYDPDKMPDDLREAHHNLDLAVDRIYRAKPFASDEERLEYLFALYEKMTSTEKLV